MKVHTGHDAFLLCLCNELAGLLHSGAHWFFADYVDTVVDGVHGDLIVGEVRRTDVDRVQIQLVDHILVIVKIVWNIQLFGALPGVECVCQSNDFNIAEAAENLYVDLTDEAGTDNSNFVNFHYSSS